MHGQNPFQPQKDQKKVNKKKPFIDGAGEDTQTNSEDFPQSRYYPPVSQEKPFMPQKVKSYVPQIKVNSQKSTRPDSNLNYFPSEQDDFTSNQQNFGRPDPTNNFRQETHFGSQNRIHSSKNNPSQSGLDHSVQNNQNSSPYQTRKNYGQEINTDSQKRAHYPSNHENFPSKHSELNSIPLNLQNPFRLQTNNNSCQDMYTDFQTNVHNPSYHGVRLNYPNQDQQNDFRLHTNNNTRLGIKAGYQNNVHVTSNHWDLVSSREVFHHSPAQTQTESFQEQGGFQDHLRSDKDLFKDSSFPHHDLSVLGQSQQDADSALPNYQGAMWEPYLKDLEIFVDGTEHKDVLQIEIGNCYLLATLGVLADKNRIKNLIAKEANTEARYKVRCFYMGDEKEIEIDSFLPVRKNEKGEIKIFTGTNGLESWVLLLEKAYAKMFKSYAASEGGSPTEAMRFYTGAPAQEFRTSNLSDEPSMKEHIWRLLNQRDSEYVFTCCTFGEASKLEAKGLVTDHAFSIMYAFTDEDKKQILKIRNPWGMKNDRDLGEWTGEYSDIDENWIKSLKMKKSDYKAENDGIFHIKYEDFLEYFATIEVCYLHKGFELQKKAKISKRNQKIAYLLTVGENINLITSFYIMVNQESARKFFGHSGFKNFKYSGIHFEVYTLGGNQPFLSGLKIDREQVWDHFNLPAGNYRIEVKVNWSDFAIENEANYFVLNTYGPDHVKLGNRLF